ncbi:MAG TPA: twin-arginine translocase subunit TatC, partial [Tenuifilaceae bacterium]|nr:twin-arginine translocase subunit TatC [Tenuifilaceae bacterium]
MVKKDKAETSEMGFLDHLEELRWVLVRAAAGILLAAIGAFVSYRFIFDYVIFGPKSPDFVTNRVLCLIAQSINAPALCINSKPLEIININMAGQFNTHLMVSLYAGIIVAFPYIIFQLWNFVKPALYEHERKRARGAVFYISLLF